MPGCALALDAFQALVLAQQFSDGFRLRGADARIAQRLLQVRVKSVGIDRSGYLFVRVKEDGIVWARLAAEFLDEGLPLFDQCGSCRGCVRSSVLFPGGLV
jgi:hypothetical protein